MDEVDEASTDIQDEKVKETVEIITLLNYHIRWMHDLWKKLLIFFFANFVVSYLSKASLLTLLLSLIF